MSKIKQKNVALDEAIRKLAHEIWEAEGRPEDRQTRHWSLAEVMLREHPQASAGAGSDKSPREAS